jgi:hypothetical protein
MPLFTKQLNKEVMNTNKFFSLNRFSRFFCADLRLNKRIYLFYFVGIAVGIYLVLLFNMSEHYDFKDYQYRNLFLFCIMGLGAFVGDAFNELNSKTKTGNYLLLPASTFEKVLSQFVIRFVFGICLFLWLFWVDAYLARETMMHTKAIQAGEYVITPFHYSTFFQPDMTLGFRLFFGMVCVSIGTFLFAGRLFFGRFGLIKSIIAGFGLFFLAACSMVLLSHLFYPAETVGWAVEFTDYNVFEDTTNFEIFTYSIFYFAWLFLLPLAYFKLKEKQV